MQTYKTLSLGQHRGAPRLWIEGIFAARAGFRAGTRYDIVKGEEKLVLRVTESGTRTVSSKVSGKKSIPVIDINNSGLLDMFAASSALRVVMREGEIVIGALASTQRRKRRTSRLLAKLKAQEPLDVGALAFGGGLMDHALHAGLNEAGVECRLRCVNEIRADLMEHVAHHNDVFRQDSQALVAPLQELAFDEWAMRQLPPLDLLTAGFPCSGASIAGRSKRGLAHAEEHPLVGHLVVAGLSVIARLNPAGIVLENVPPYAKSSSASILRTQLREFGYELYEREFVATEWGDLERRTRWCLVALSRGIEFDLQSMRPAPFKPRQLSELLEPFEDVMDRYSKMLYLKEKELRDRAAGKGFQMQIFSGEETSINTLTKGIAKNRSTDPKIAHPSDPDLLRIPTALEHARCKGAPERLIQDLPQTTAHELLGQAVCYSPFKALGLHLGQALKRFGCSVSEAMIDGLIGSDFKAAASVG